MVNQINVTTNVVTLGAPDKVTTWAAAAGDMQVTLDWAAPADNGSAITGYKIYRSVSGGAYSLLTSPGAAAVQYIDTGLTNETLYRYYIIATNGLGNSPQSDPVTGIPSTSPATVAISMQRSDLEVAPEGMVFTAVVSGFDTPGPTASTNTYDPRFHEIYYDWDFGDTGATFTKPARILSEHTDANKAYGPIASHTYSLPGTYTVTLNAVEPASGKTAQTTIQVTVGDPDALYADNKTIFVDPDGDYTNAPAGAATELTLVDAIATANASGNHCRIMLSRDKTHLLNGVLLRANSFYLCDSPVGTELPILKCWNVGAPSGRGAFYEDMAANTPGKIADCRIININAQGYWDATTETLDPSAPFQVVPVSFYYSTEQRSTYLLLHNCKIEGFATCVYFSRGRYSNGTIYTCTNVISDCEISNWNNFGLYAEQTGYFGLTGTSIAQSVDALAGGQKVVTGPSANNFHGSVRLQECDNVAIDGCDFYTNTGWYENILGMHTTQPALRLAQRSPEFTLMNVQRCYAESAGPAISHSPQDVNFQAYGPNTIIEKSYLISGWCAPAVVQSRHTGLTLRNNVIITPVNNLPSLYGGGAFGGKVGAVGLDAHSSWVTNKENVPVKIYNNTFVTTGTQTENLVATVPYYAQNTAQFQDITVENNLNYFPNLPTGAQHAIDTTTLFAARYDGYRSWKHVVQGTLAADVAPGQSFTIPYGSFGGGVTGASDFDLAAYDGDSRNARFVVDGVSTILWYTVNMMDTSRYSITTDGTGVVFTNDGPETWPSGAAYTAVPIRSSVYFRSEYANPANTIINASPTPESSAIGGANPAQAFSYRDILGNLRNQTTPSLGAYEAPRP